MFDGTVPMEMLNFFPDLHFDQVVTVFTDLKGIRFADKLVRLVETPQVCALYTAGQLFMLVFKDQLSESQREEFRSFLRTKPTQIKKL
jgi:hypothetical protein